MLELKVSFVQLPGHRTLREDGGEHERNTEERVEGRIRTDGIDEAVGIDGIGGSDGFDGVEARALQSRCSPIDKARCCSQGAINSDGKLGRYCRSRGCTTKNCGAGRQRRNSGSLIPRLAAAHDRSVQSRDSDDAPGGRDLRIAPYALKDVDFALAVRRNTPFAPLGAEAHVQARNLDAMAACSINRYTLEMVRLRDALLCGSLGPRLMSSFACCSLYRSSILPR